MIISFEMPKRIITCCGIKNDEREDIKLFYDKRYLFQEIYYVKLINDDNIKFNQIICCLLFL